MSENLTIPSSSYFSEVIFFFQNTRESYHEKCVMNNYFGIGLDAKITLEFQNKREEHPEKCRSEWR